MKRSAGILLYRLRDGALEVLLVHPGGPFWARKNAAAWSIPKGGIEPDEAPVDAARREFREELGFEAPRELVELAAVRQASGKTVQAWAAEGDWDPAGLASLAFEMEWPPRSGRMQSFPEVDRAEWFSLEAARERLVAGQVPLIDALQKLVAAR